MDTSDGSGHFRIERSGFAAPADCTVDVNDGSATAATARLSGCTVSSSSPPPSNPPPSTCTIVPETFADGGVPGYTWTLRSGQLSPGLQLTVSPGRSTGTPTARGTFSFIVRATA